jgi:hypothetical protein
MTALRMTVYVVATYGFFLATNLCASLLVATIGQ